MEDVQLIENYGTSGEGVLGAGAHICCGSGARLNRLLVSQNHGSGHLGAGGGLYASGSTVIISESEFSHNTTAVEAPGAALYCASGSTSIIATLFLGNEAGQYANGGALQVAESCNLSAVNSMFAGNQGGGGGAINTSGQTSVVNSLFIGNTSVGGQPDFDAGGGALRAFSGATVTVMNSTLIENNANDFFDLGDALHALDEASIMVSNSVFWSNDAVPISIAEEGDITLDHVLLEGGCPDGISCSTVVDVDPQFLRPPDPGPDEEWGTEDDDYGDLHVTFSSPAVDGGHAALLPPDTFDLDGDGDVGEPLPLDYDGGPRVQGLAVDLGAYESPFTVAVEPAAGGPPTSTLTAASPNPFSGTTELALNMIETQHVRIAMFDALGRRVRTLHEGMLPAGRHQIVLDGTDLPSGVYVVRAESEAFRLARPIVKLR